MQALEQIPLLQGANIMLKITQSGRTIFRAALSKKLVVTPRCQMGLLRDRATKFKR